MSNKIVDNLDPTVEALLQGNSFFFTKLWRITRSDATELRFTSHNRPVVYEGDTFVPVASVAASADELVEGLKGANVEVRGVLDSSYITEADIRLGKYDYAEIEEILIDWRFPFNGDIATYRWFISEIQFTADSWRADLKDITHWLYQPFGAVATRLCRWRLGQGQCAGHSGDGVDLATITETGEVTAIHTQKKVIDTDLSGFSDNHFKYGLLTWTSGNNTGFESEVKKSKNADGRIYLWLRTPFEIEVGDEFEVYQGCDKNISTCIDDFDNVHNFGGYPWLPGNDELNRTPNVL